MVRYSSHLNPSSNALVFGIDSGHLKKRVISFAFFSPLNHNLNFSYEQVLSNQISFHGTFGIIGPGIVSDDRKPAGIFVKAGPRFYFSPDYTMDGMHRFNNLQGGYFQPEIIINDYSAYEATGLLDISPLSNDRVRQNHLAVAMMMNFGKQWVFVNAFSIDTYIGIGYGAGGSSAGNQYSHYGGSPGMPFALSTGLSVGFLSK